MSSYLLDKRLPSRIADALRYAAAPTFAVLAVLCGLPSDQSGPTLCAGIPSQSHLQGMSVMYLLMASFHAGPWLKLIARSR